MIQLVEYFSLSGLVEGRSRFGSIQEWISNNRFSSVRIEDGAWVLAAYDHRELARSAGGDFERFLFSAIETRRTADLERLNLPVRAWPLLKTYYSGFFAAHSISSSTGRGVIYLRRNARDAINDFITAIGSTAKPIDGGSYKYWISRSGVEYDLVLAPASLGSGVHDMFWRSFSDTFSELAAEYLDANLPDSREVFAETSHLVDAILENRRSNAWISRIRNEINYEHRHHAWLPTKRSDPIRRLSEDDFKGFSTFQLETGGPNEELEKFQYVSRYLGKVAETVAENFVELVGGNASFSRRYARLKQLLQTV